MMHMRSEGRLEVLSLILNGEMFYSIFHWCEAMQRGRTTTLLHSITSMYTDGLRGLPSISIPPPDPISTV